MSQGLEKATRKMITALRRPVPNFSATVTRIDTRAAEVDVVPDSGSTEIFGVRLKMDGQTEKNGVMEVPAMGSRVLIGRLGEEDHFVLMCSEVKQVIVNGGNNGGLINIKDLVAQLDRNNEILDKILEAVSGAPVTEPGNGAPSALQQKLRAALTGLRTGDFSNIEDDSITH